MSKIIEEKLKISPKQFMKSRKPSQFSDSEIIEESSIDRTVLEFNLDTLSSRSQEIDFERFGIRLCKLAITPNLIPNTGPTGGGDAKVDSETYPVSDSTTLGWHTAINPESSKEPWGFAFSVQKKWGEKIRDDVKKIHEAQRDYKVAYFVTSRSVRSKDRARVQDELRQKYGIDIVILDRNWILDQVFENKRENVVKEELHVNGITETKIKRSPLDLQKEEDLTVLNKKIEESIGANKLDNSLVDDALDAAILSRKLEKPRAETDGRFYQAKRLAEKYGSVFQKFDTAYQFAWTTFWWHEDFSMYFSLYEEAEKLANPTNVYDLERLNNLWLGVNNLKNNKLATVDETFLNQRTAFLKEKLKNLSADEDKPSASVYAKTILLEIELTQKIFANENIDKEIKEFKEVIIKSKKLVGYPFKVFVGLLTEMDSYLENSAEYDELFKTIIQASEERDGELSAAKLQLNRGEKLLKIGEPYKAIRELGASLIKIYKYESKDDAVRALYLIALAYEDVGLTWVARGSLLAASSLATSGFWNYGEINTMQALCYKRLKWLELKIGRIPQAFDWHQLDNAIRNILSGKGFTQKVLFEEINKFDMALGIVFLRADFEVLKKLESIPDLLLDLGLDFSREALFYSLGYEKELSQEFKDTIPPEEYTEFFAKWASQYSSEVLPFRLIDTENDTVQLISVVLGCKIIVDVDNSSPCLEVAESILSAIEGFLSTAIVRGAGSREEDLKIIVRCDGEDLLKHEFESTDNGPVIKVHCSEFNPHSVSVSNQEKLSDAIFSIVADIAGRVVIFRDAEKDLIEMMRDERVQDRTNNFTSSFVTLGNVLGHQPKTKISDLSKGKHAYPLQRVKPLDFPKAEQDNSDQEDSLSGKSLFQAKHTEIKTSNIIRNELWDKAKWMGAGYIVHPSYPPVISILFENIEAGRKIFTAWENKVGSKDEEDRIRVSIVSGINKKNPYHYRVGIGTNIDKEGKNKPKYIMTMTRMHTMNPTSSKNVDMFKEAYKKWGFYVIAPGVMGKDGFPEIDHKKGIAKRELNFREAWEIGSNDLDSPLIILSDDSPVIPVGVKNPPVVELLKAKENYSNK